MRQVRLLRVVSIFFLAAVYPAASASGKPLSAGSRRGGAAWRQDRSFNLPPGVPILVDSSEAGPIAVAVQDLQRDLEKVLGVASPVVTSESAIAGRPAIVVTCAGAATVKYRDATLAGFESHELRAKGTSREPRIVLEGVDTRGTIYAIYEFSDDYLKVPPL
jgi:hypothetical protein